MTSQLRVLLIEDNAGDADLVREYLSQSHKAIFEVECVPSLAQAISILEQDQIDVILLDLGLPDSSGLETLSRVLKTAPGSATVVLTGLDDDVTGLESVRLGAQDYLFKGHLSRDVLIRTTVHSVERKRTQDALRESEEQFRSLFENSLDAILLTIPDGRILRANPAACQMFGLTQEEICRAERNALVDTSDPRLKPGLEERKRTGKFQGELNFKREDGSIFPAELSTVLFKDAEGQWKTTMIIRDVTGRRRSEEAQKRLATAVEQAAEAIVITDNRGTIQYVNPAFERITGYSEEEAIGQNPRLLKSGEHDKKFYKQMWETIQGGHVWSGCLVNRRKDGQIYHEEATISPVKDASGTIVNFVAVKRDITEHLELSKQLLQAQKMEAVGTLAGGVAHDFNNILQVGLGYSELILGSEGLPQRYKADLRKINESAKRGAELVQRLLTFSRKTEVKPLPLNLNRRITELRKMLERTVPKMIEIQLLLAEDLATIHADATQVDQILMNLAVNARDAMPDGGRLVIETANVILGDEYATAHFNAKPGHYVLLIVADNGSGINEENLEHIFEPFYTTKEAGVGTGLGLAMVYGIVQQHGGCIRCLSEPGEGTTFKIYFPALVSEEEPEDNTAIPVPRGGSETILIVDDEDMIRDLGSRILQKSGYKVITASNGRQALEVYQERGSEISLVILDLIMPQMGGKQCLELISLLDPGVKVVIASGYSANGAAEEALFANSKGFVNKPYEISQLLEVVRSVLDEKTDNPYKPDR
jgi:two-component system, cell cycle sensor histidine kinase and response regulator CckA